MLELEKQSRLTKTKENDPNPIHDIKDRLGFVTSEDNTSRVRFLRQFETKNFIYTLLDRKINTPIK